MGPTKTFRDPVHGDIQLPRGVLGELGDLPDFQRLRRIRQLGACYFTFHGAEHSRFQHSLGATWLAYQVLRSWMWQEAVEISPAEFQATLCAVLLHDVGHGPFSHALEHVFSDVDHEAIGQELILTRFRGCLERHGVEPELVCSILRGDYARPVFHELVCGQLDVDRLDYLMRDSYFTGVRYGLFDVERILGHLVAVYDLERNAEVLAVDAKAVEAVEAFLFSRYFMHWQVYFHRTVRAAEFLLRCILARARSLAQEGVRGVLHPPGLEFLFRGSSRGSHQEPGFLAAFVGLDDSDLIQAIKLWQSAPDAILADLCRRFLGRQLPKVVEGRAGLAEEVRQVVARRFPRVEFYWGVDRPSDLALEDERVPIRVLTGRGRQWSHLAEVTRSRALRSLGERISQEFIFYPWECREEVEVLVN